MQGVRFLASGWNHIIAVTDDHVFAWGSNSHGQLGTRTLRSCQLPTEVMDLHKMGVCQVACGAAHSLFCCRDGSVYGCGSTEHGQLPLVNQAHPWPTPAEAAASVEVEEQGQCVTAPALLRLSFLRGSASSKPAAVSQIVAAEHCSAFLTRAADELPDVPHPRLWERLQAAVAAAAEAPSVESQAYIRPIAAAVERIFGSAAAISAAFGIKDKVSASRSTARLALLLE